MLIVHPRIQFQNTEKASTKDLIFSLFNKN